MRWATRKTRIAIVLAMAVVVAVVAYRASQRAEQGPPCEPGRIEEKDASGKVTKITRTECRN
jgi:hypothetical protein